MSDADIQMVSNDAGEPTAVIVPIALWNEIASERETAYLLKSEPAPGTKAPKSCYWGAPVAWKLIIPLEETRVLIPY